MRDHHYSDNPVKSCTALSWSLCVNINSVIRGILACVGLRRMAMLRVVSNRNLVSLAVRFVSVEHIYILEAISLYEIIFQEDCMLICIYIMVAQILFRSEQPKSSFF